MKSVPQRGPEFRVPGFEFRVSSSELVNSELQLETRNSEPGTRNPELEPHSLPHGGTDFIVPFWKGATATVILPDISALVF